jgi:methylated-DNA-[protein]-cysteine S-methyltransferase
MRFSTLLIAYPTTSPRNRYAIPDQGVASAAPASAYPAPIRAIGAANGANPISIAVPCHRLVGGDGKLVKYGGGLRRKAWLLRHEGAR